MKKTIAVILALMLIIPTVIPLCLSAVTPSQWAATDGLGRTLTLSEEKREDKFVGLFYWTWHYPWTDREPLNNTRILKEHPEAKYDFYNECWGCYDDGGPQFWDEPLLGYYSDLDEYVLRKHAELIADAGVDVIIFDCTNGTLTWDDATEVLFRVWEEAKNEGVNVPQVAFMLPFWGEDLIRTDLIHLYDSIYSKGRYSDLWFMWKGKPLIMGDAGALDKSDAKQAEIADFFTFRKNDPGYFSKDTFYNRFGENKWGWCSEYPQTLYGRKSLFGKACEQICVSVAQNCNEDGLCAMNAEGEVQGRNYTKGSYSYSFDSKGKTVTVDKNTENALYYGLNFQQQWDFALKADPEFIFVTGFNEWIAGRYIEWQGTKNASPDQYNCEFSRDIEPSAGEMKDYYYYQLVENIRKFKGTDTAPANNAQKTIDIEADISQWDDVQPEYTHYTGSTKERSMAGWKGTFYENHTMRNDIVSSKVAYDDENIYFLVKTKDSLSPSSDNAWMRLFIDTDTTGISPNWESFEYVINRNSPENNVVTVEKSEGGWNFTPSGTGSCSVADNTLQFAIPRSALGLDGTDEVRFNFKWSDNMQKDGDIMDFYQNGDVAPGGRFTFVFDSEADGTTTENKDNNFISFLLKIWNFIVKFFKGDFTC